MAVLSASDRLAGYIEYLRLRNQEKDGLECIKPDIKAAFDALDSYFNTNAAAINTAIPQPARANLTTPQKAMLAIAVLERRYLSGV